MRTARSCGPRVVQVRRRDDLLAEGNSTSRRPVRILPCVHARSAELAVFTPLSAPPPLRRGSRPRAFGLAVGAVTLAGLVAVCFLEHPTSDAANAPFLPPPILAVAASAEFPAASSIVSGAPLALLQAALEHPFADEPHAAPVPVPLAAPKSAVARQESRSRTAKATPHRRTHTKTTVATWPGQVRSFFSRLF